MPLHSTEAFVLATVLGFIFLATPNAAQAQYQVESWTTDNGLPQNTVHSILQTRDGYLWLATLDGLVRYDGVKFTVFNKNNTKGINSNRFTQLIVDAHDNLWIGTESSGVTRYHNGAFQTYAIAGEAQRQPIWNLVLNNQGELVVSTELGIVRWNGEKFVAHQALAGETKGSILLWGKDGAFWYANGRTLHRFKDGRTSDYHLAGAEKESTLHDLYEDREGRLWVGTVSAGLLLIENEHLMVYTVKDGLPSNHISPRIEDKDGNLWAVTAQGAVIFSDGKISRLTTEQGLSDNALSAIYPDREGNVWIGTYYRGLNRLSRQSVTFYTKENGLAADIVHPIYEDREGSVWLGGKSLTRWRDGRFGQVPGREKLPQEVTAIHQDRQGRLWFGSWGGAYYYENGKFTDFTDKFAATPQLADIHEDRYGTLWFASTMGLFRYRNGAMARLTTNEGLAGNEVKVICEAHDGTLWIGTYGGLTQLKDGVFASFTTSTGLASNLVRSLYEDKDGVLWIGSYDGGLTRLKDGKFTRYTTNDGLFNDGVFQILEDGGGNLWISCNRGIYRVAKQQLNDFAEGRISRINSTAYGKADGLLETECNGGQQPAGIRARDGKLWFPTQRGVAVIDPGAIKTNPQAPPVLIESFAANGVTSATLGSVIEVPTTTENLEIAYTGLSFTKPEQMRFKYRMSGLDSDWVDADARRTAYYSHLPPGEYDFTVIAANSDGIWNNEGASVRVHVVPPFYRTRWFLILSLGLMGSAAFLFYRWRIAQLKKEQAAQQAFSQHLIESEEAERKRIAVELHDGLGQSLVVIKNRALIGLNTPDNHDRLLSQMGEISEAASAAMSEVRGIARNLHPYQLDYLGLTAALKTMIESVADVSNIAFTTEIDELDGELPKAAEINLYRIVQEALNNVVKHSAATKVRVSLKKTGRSLDVVVEDNGKGFATDAKRPTPGLGLVGINERARMLHARHEIRSAPGKGTTVVLQMNLPEKSHEH
jgi:ligand-binding sensor domain-containing protein/signal transduction histidine kinase